MLSEAGFSPRLVCVAVLGLIALCIGRLVHALAALSVPVDVTHMRQSDLNSMRELTEFVMMCMHSTLHLLHESLLRCVIPLAIGGLPKQVERTVYKDWDG